MKGGGGTFSMVYNKMAVEPQDGALPLNYKTWVTNTISSGTRQFLFTHPSLFAAESFTSPLTMASTPP